MLTQRTARFLLLGILFFPTACQKTPFSSGGGLPASLKDVPAVRLNYRYEPDVPAPTEPAKTADERNAAVQSNFDQTRPQEILDKTLTSPDGKRVLAVYHRAADLPSEFRLDMYSAEGELLNKITSDLMAAHFPDTIRWSPDSANLAFVAMLRGVPAEPEANHSGGTEVPDNTAANSNPPLSANSISNSNIEVADANSNVDANTNALPAAPTPLAPSGILTFRTEQIYICDADGGSTKPLTQNEGLIYFYYVWSPDSSMLAALAATSREWQYLQYRAETSGETFVPVGRPRIVEKNGRERRLDDAMTAVQPVWSPDSAKVAAGYETQVRIYDAGGIAPTQAAILLRNHLLISSQAFDLEQQRKLEAANVPTDANAQPAPAANPGQPVSTLPDEKTLVSFNPIIALSWPADDLLYLHTAFVRRLKNESDGAYSFPRWHRLILTPQAAPAAVK